MLPTNKNAFYAIYKSRAEYKDKQSIISALFKKLVNKGVYDFKSKRSKQVIFRFKAKINI